MVKVECTKCGLTGYTASPQHLICACGGRFREVPECHKGAKVTLTQEAMALYDITAFIYNAGIKLN